MKRPVIIPIYFKSESFDAYESMKEDLGIEGVRPDISESDVRDVTFYNINAVCVYRENGKEYGCVMSNADEFISPLSAKQINLAITDKINNLLKGQ
jgi:hypothetical protein